MEKLVLGKVALQSNIITTTVEDDAVTKKVQQIIEQAIQQLSPQQKKCIYSVNRQVKSKMKLPKNSIFPFTP